MKSLLEALDESRQSYLKVSRALPPSRTHSLFLPSLALSLPRALFLFSIALSLLYIYIYINICLSFSLPLTRPLFLVCTYTQPHRARERERERERENMVAKPVITSEIVAESDIYTSKYLLFHIYYRWWQNFQSG
jgi:hypothetical protein